ncbi:MAG: hypothetical protein WAS21_22795 [Geminicoccaceae bacterium]|jgi:ElaB/YqjD/DUF883 family membrane-anchored ribosome-binding protein
MVGPAQHLRAATHNLANIDTDTIRKDLTSLKDELDRVLGTMQDTGVSALATARREGSAMVERVATDAGALAEDLGERGRQQASIMGRRVREQPLLALGIAFGTGLLVGALATRR